MQKLITLICLVLTGSLTAQQIDMDRMNRNLEAAENILSTLFESASQTIYEGDDDYFVFKNENNVGGTYIQGFGALFTVSPGIVLGNNKPLILGDDEHIERIIVENEVLLELARKKGRSRRDSDWDQDDYAENSTYTREIFEKAVREFVKDYAYLLRQIPPREKIMIRLGGMAGRQVVSGLAIYSKKSGKTYYSAAVLKSDVDAYLSSSMTEERLYEKISFIFPEAMEEGEEDRNLRMVSNIFTDLYRSHDDNPLDLTARISYEQINGLGAIYYIDMNRHFGSLAPVVTIRGRASKIFATPPQERDDFEHEERLEEAERVYSREEHREEIKRELESSYQDFLQDLQYNIVEYGSIIRDLKPDEALIFKVRFDQRRDVLPKEVEITATQSILNSFRSNKLNLEQAVQKLKIQEIR